MLIRGGAELNPAISRAIDVPWGAQMVAAADPIAVATANCDGRDEGRKHCHRAIERSDVQERRLASAQCSEDRRCGVQRGEHLHDWHVGTLRSTALCAGRRHHAAERLQSSLARMVRFDGRVSPERAESTNNPPSRLVGHQVAILWSLISKQNDIGAFSQPSPRGARRSACNERFPGGGDLLSLCARRGRQIDVVLCTSNLQDSCTELGKQTSAKRHARPVRPFKDDDIG